MESNRRSDVALAICVTDSVVYPHMGSMTWERQMSTPPKLQSEYYGIFRGIAPGMRKFLDVFKLINKKPFLLKLKH